MPVPPPSSSSTSSTSLVPIRVDAWTSDKSFRLIDSLLYDLSGPPPPAVFTGTSSPTTLADQLAYQICADAEVMGMGRTARHFTNRLEVWKPELQREVARQIAEQLDAAASQDYSTKKSSSWSRSGSSGSRGRKRLWSGTDGETVPASKHPRETSCRDPDPVPSLTTTQSDPKAVPPTTTALDEDTAEAASGCPPQPNQVESVNTATPIVPHPPTPELVASTCIHIRLRMAAYGVRVHDDFYIDPSHPDSSPLLLAQSLGADLTLPYEVIQAIAMEIAEQLRGRVVVQDDMALQDGGDEGHPPTAVMKHPNNVTAAWMLEQRVHISNVAHLVQQHRPDSMVLMSSAQSPPPTSSKT